MKEKLLEVKNLHISFFQNGSFRTGIKNLSFHLAKGEILGIVGESGCGKSICSEALLRLLPNNAFLQNGEIVLDGEDLLKKKPSELKAIRGRKIGMIFQNPLSSLNPSMKVGRQITEVLLNHKLCSKVEAKKRALALLELVGISEGITRFEQYPHELSGGLCQRIAIASALAAEPEILIADEPTTALDASIQIQILALLLEIQEKRQMSMILISHDLRVVMRICSRVLIMYAGQIVEEGNVNDVLGSPKHPYTKALLEATPYFGTESNQRLQAIPGTPPCLANLSPGCPFAPRCPSAMNICLTPPSFYSFENEQKSACWLHDSRRVK